MPVAIQNGSNVWSGPSLPIPGWIRIFRPLNLLIVFIGCTVGSMLVHGASISSGDLPYLTLISGLSAVFLAGFGNITNDIADIKIDRINRSDRALPSAEVSVPAAWLLSLTCLASALALASSLSTYHVAVVCAAAVVLTTYNWMFKRVFLVGTVAVSGLVAVTVGYGALTGASSGGRAAPLDVIMESNVLVAMCFAFALTLIREVVKDMEDIAGDSANGVRSLPMIVGTDRAGHLVRGTVGLVILAIPLPYLLFPYSGIFLLMMIPVVALLVRVLAMLGDSEVNAAQISRHLKLSMLLGLFALALAAAWPA
jgi:geranylgeranylglycerol-phosphate geranylgeranyltransferase